MIFFFAISKRYKHSPWFQPRERNDCLARIVYPWLKPRVISDNWIFVLLMLMDFDYGISLSWMD
jgi:hypothetical protein